MPTIGRCTASASWRTRSTPTTTRATHAVKSTRPQRRPQRRRRVDRARTRTPMRARRARPATTALDARPARRTAARPPTSCRARRHKTPSRAVGYCAHHAHVVVGPVDEVAGDGRPNDTAWVCSVKRTGATFYIFSYDRTAITMWSRTRDPLDMGKWSLHVHKLEVNYRHRLECSIVPPSASTRQIAVGRNALTGRDVRVRRGLHAAAEADVQGVQ